MSNGLGKCIIQEYGLTELEATTAKFSDCQKQFLQIMAFLEVVEESAQLPDDDLICSSPLQQFPQQKMYMITKINSYMITKENDTSNNYS
jgi:hypothetical protein